MDEETMPEPQMTDGQHTGLLAVPRRHPRAFAATAMIGAVTLLAGFLWFRPDKIFVDESVQDMAPMISPSALIAAGVFRSLDHDTTGKARLLRSGGETILRFEGLRTSNGPDLIVLLSDTPTTQDDGGAYDDGKYTNLGPLKGNIGDQNYLIPSGTDLDAYRSVVIWCRRFKVAFGAAPLELRS